MANPFHRKSLQELAAERAAREAANPAFYFAPCGCRYPLDEMVPYYEYNAGGEIEQHCTRRFGTDGHADDDRAHWRSLHKLSNECPRGKSGELKVTGVL